MSPEQITKFTQQYKQPAFRVQQAIEAFCVHGASSFQDITPWPKALREAAEKELQALSLKEEQVLRSGSKAAYKALLKLPDGNYVETVLLSPKPGLWSTCISSQVGCGMGCTFCATGKLGFMRNLTAEEICDQVLFWMQYMKKHNLDGRLNNIVYMGMGEPFANYAEVNKSLQILTNPKVFNFGDRHISVSTSGLVPGIIQLAKQWPQVNLAISLHATNDTERSEMMPINNTYNIKKLQNALKKYFQYTNRKVFLEYILLKDKNDTPRHAKELAEFVQAVEKPHLLHVNLIVYNKTASKFEETPRERAQQFCNLLKRHG